MRKCNCCGRELYETQDDALVVTKNWGYFSKRDGKRHEFTICEPCYELMVAGWKLPVQETDNNELL